MWYNLFRLLFSSADSNGVCQDCPTSLESDPKIIPEIVTNRIARYREYSKILDTDKDLLGIFRNLIGKSWRITDAENLKIRNYNGRHWNWLTTLATFGDLFLEKVVDDDGEIIGLHSLPPDTMFRIETVKGKLLEFQQSKIGPVYGEIKDNFSTIRFSPEHIIHARLPASKSKFYPYGESILEMSPSSWNTGETAFLLANCLLEEMRDNDLVHY